MEHFTHSFIITLIHSIWQALLLWGIYGFTNKLLPHNHPVAKRNAAFLFLCIQFLVSIFTFLFLLYSNSLPLNGPLETVSTISRLTVLHSFSGYLVVIYLAIVMYKLLGLVVQWHVFKKQCLQHFLKPNQDLLFYTHAKAKSMGIKKRINVWLSPHIHSPLTYGFFKPVILLPFALVNRLTIEETESLVLHELAHIKQNDFFLNWFLLLTETVYFFNPFLQRLTIEIRKQREFSCDVQVVEQSYSPVLYAQALYKTASQRFSANAFTIAAAQNVELLLNRIVFFSNTNNHFLPKRNPVLAPLLSLTLMIVLLFAGSPNDTKNLNPAIKPLHATNLPSSKTVTSNVHETQKLFSTLPNITLKSSNTRKPLEERQQVTAKEINKPGFENHYNGIPFNLIPVNYIARADSVNEIIISEENSGGSSITKSYKLSYINGKWEISLLWMVENKNAGDTLQLKSDSASVH